MSDYKEFQQAMLKKGHTPNQVNHIQLAIAHYGERMRRSKEMRRDDPLPPNATKAQIDAYFERHRQMSDYVGKMTLRDFGIEPLK